MVTVQEVATRTKKRLVGTRSEWLQNTLQSQIDNDEFLRGLGISFGRLSLLIDLALFF